MTASLTCLGTTWTKCLLRSYPARSLRLSHQTPKLPGSQIDLSRGGLGMVLYCEVCVYRVKPHALVQTHVCEKNYMRSCRCTSDSSRMKPLVQREAGSARAIARANMLVSFPNQQRFLAAIKLMSLRH
ncbi:hypothetical protein NDU88_001952 [Pleurodeles waltl]|uniref:Uncharacterized protein n=1 Tax=Pleurodeles waltl TaxID=8319 RepID=A0AAV7UVJ2_PLEWA|nr:hypothetical protein NDU88_001952 [Pleurodeles waltl]